MEEMHKEMVLHANIIRLYLFSFLKMTLFPMAIITLFWKDQIGLSLTDILLLQAIFSITSVLFEYPSGYISDRIGYKSALLLASILSIFGWTYYSFANSFFHVLIAEVILGCSWAFISGSDSALLYETLRMQGRETIYSRYDGRMTGCAQVGEAAGAIFAGVMYAYWPLMPFVFQIGVWIGACILCLGLKEPEQMDEHHISSHLTEALTTCRYALIENRHIRTTLVFGACLGLGSFYMVWFVQPYMQETSVPVTWFGPVWAGANLMVAFSSFFSHRLRLYIGERWMIVLFVTLVVIGYIGLSLTSAAYGFLFYYLLTCMRGLQGPMMRNLLQQASSRRNRASILSIYSLVFRLLFVLSGPLVGMLADKMGLRPTFGVLAGLFTLTLVPAAYFFYSILPVTGGYTKRQGPQG